MLISCNHDIDLYKRFHDFCKGKNRKNELFNVMPVTNILLFAHLCYEN